MKKLILIIIGTVLLLAGCSTEQEGLPVVSYVNFKVYDPVYVGIDKGFFEKRGIVVDIVGDTLAGPTGIQVVASGAANGALSSIPAIINANLAGLPVIAVSDIQSAIGEQPLETYYSRCEDNYYSIDDLIGKTVAVNLWYSSFHYTIIMELEKHGYQESDLTYSLIPFGNQIEALIGGDVEMIGLMEPYNSMAKNAYPDQLCEVFNAIDTFGTKQFCTHLINRVWAENNPELATAFVGGIADSIAWIENNQDEARAIIAKYTEIPVEFVPDYHFQENGMVIMEDIQFWFDYLKSKDANPEKYWMGIDYIATNKYNDKVK